VITDNILVVSEFHYRYFVLLAFLLIIIDLSVPVIKKFSAFSDLVLEGRSLILETNGHFSDFPVNHRLSLTFHHVSEILKFLSFTFLACLVS
jgi:hypothetical protein